MDVNITNNKLFEINESDEVIKQRIQKNIDLHTKFVKKLIQDPYKYYKIFSNRYDTDGLNSSFLEFEPIVNFLMDNIKLKILKENNKILLNIAYIKLIDLINISYYTKQKPYPYGETLRVIFSSLEFFDLIEREYNAEGLGVYYHILNYKYYWNNLMDIRHIKNNIFFPTIFNKLGATHMIQMRSVPIYLCGVTITKTYVDEFFQSPMEFFMHDVNHSRRMSENMLNEIKQRNSSLDLIIQESLKFKEEILKLIIIKSNDDEQIKGIKQLIRILIFEIIHEDAKYLLPDIIWDALHRNEDYVYVFERTFINEKNQLDVKDQPINVEGALAYTKYKLQHKFYDDGTQDYIVLPKYRYANYLTFAGIIILIYLRSMYENFPSIKTYSYYLSRTANNVSIPRPIHNFKVGNNEDPNNLDRTCLKTGLPQNCWVNGYRRVVGEYLNNMIYNKINNDDPLYQIIEKKYDLFEHQKDLELFQQIFSKFQNQNEVISHYNFDILI